MREFSVPPLVVVPPETNITDLVLRQAAKPSNPALFSRLDIRASQRASGFVTGQNIVVDGGFSSVTI